MFRTLAAAAIAITGLAAPVAAHDGHAPSYITPQSPYMAPGYTLPAYPGPYDFCPWYNPKCRATTYEPYLPEHRNWCINNPACGNSLPQQPSYPLPSYPSYPPTIYSPYYAPY